MKQKKSKFEKELDKDTKKVGKEAKDFFNKLWNG
jgi:hypothetical protein